MPMAFLQIYITVLNGVHSTRVGAEFAPLPHPFIRWIITAKLLLGFVLVEDLSRRRRAVIWPLRTLHRAGGKHAGPGVFLSVPLRVGLLAAPRAE